MLELNESDYLNMLILATAMAGGQTALTHEPTLKIHRHYVESMAQQVLFGRARLNLELVNDYYEISVSYQPGSFQSDPSAYLERVVTHAQAQHASEEDAKFLRSMGIKP